MIVAGFKLTHPFSSASVASHIRLPICNYRPFLFVHMLFALYVPKVESINTVFRTVFRALCRLIDVRLLNISRRIRFRS